MRQTAQVRRSGVIAVTVLLLAACSSSSTSSGDADLPTPGPDWPLTGIPSDDPSVDVEGPVVTVKVDNVAAAMPQTGLAEADIMVEEPVEGGVTRLAVFFHSSVTGTVGPVRSIRSSDVGIVSPARAVMLASGGAPEALDDFDEAGIETRFEGTPGFTRDAGRVAPHNLFVDLAEAYAALDEPGPPGPFFDFADAAGLPDGTPVEDLVLVYSPEQATRLVGSSGAWTRELATPDGFSADTVIALSVEQGTADYLDPSGAPVPINITEGTGTGWLAHAGEVVEIEWAKESETAPWTFTSGESEVGVPPGRTFLAILPVTTGSLQVIAPENTGEGE